MPETIIRFTDDDGGGVSVTLDFGEPVTIDGPCTQGQAFAMRALELLSRDKADSVLSVEVGTKEALCQAIAKKYLVS